MMTGKAGRVAGKQALITGAAGGLGEAMVWMLAREGAKIIAVDILDSIPDFRLKLIDIIRDRLIPMMRNA